MPEDSLLRAQGVYRHEMRWDGWNEERKSVPINIQKSQAIGLHITAGVGVLERPVSTWPLLLTRRGRPIFCRKEFLDQIQVQALLRGISTVVVRVQGVWQLEWLWRKVCGWLGSTPISHWPIPSSALQTIFNKSSQQDTHSSKIFEQYQVFIYWMSFLAILQC